MLETLKTTGLSLIPLHSATNGKCSCGKADCGSPAKHPKTKNGVKDASNDPDQIQQWFSGDNPPNIGIATGEPSGIIVIDEDEKDAYFSWHIANQKPTVPTWSVKTAKGTHYYFRFDERCKALKNGVKFAPGLDLRTTGGYVVGPGSVHVSGTKYEWINGPSGPVPLADLPDWMIELLPKKDEAKAVTPVVENNQPKAVPMIFNVTDSSDGLSTQDRAIAFLQRCPAATSGQNGHGQTFKTCCRLIELFGSLSDDELIECLQDWNSRCEPSWSESDLRRKLSEARKKTEPEEPEVTQHLSSDNENGDDDLWPVLDDDALIGITGDMIRAIDPETEADPVAILISFLTAFGNAVGNRPYFAVGSDHHCGNLFSCIVGDTASGKGQSWGLVQSLMRKIDPEWVNRSISHGGMSSGEGFVERLQDEENENPLFVQPLQNVLFFESEFAKPITAMRRESNTLSSVLRSSWDRSTLSILTRGKSKLVASNAFVSILSHITPEELRKLLKDSIESANGFSNRFLWCLVRSEKSLPHGGNVSVLDQFVERLRSILQAAKGIGQVSRSPEADRLWEAVYSELKRSGNGSFGRAIERARPQVLRLSLLYALLDSSNVIHVDHLKAALAVWRYCSESARLIFGSADDPQADSLETKILSILADGPKTKTEIRDRLSSSKRRDAPHKLDSLVQAGRLVVDGQKYSLAVGRLAVLASDQFPDEGGQNDQRPKRPEWPTASVVENGQTTGTAKTANGQNVQVVSVDIGELLHWKNENGIEFYRDDDGTIWVTPEHESKVTPAIASAIRDHQNVLQNFVPKPEPKPEPESIAIDYDSYFAALKAMAKPVDDIDTLLLALETKL